MIRPGACLVVLAVLGGGILLCIVGGAVQRLPDDVGNMPPHRTMLYVVWAAGAGTLYAATIATLPLFGLGRQALAVVLLLGGAMRVVTFLPPPLLSTVVYRYVWDGRERALVDAVGTRPLLGSFSQHGPMARPGLLALCRVVGRRIVTG